MIVFELGCNNHHRFEGWFASNEDFERQLSDKLLTCPLCGASSIERLPHAAHVRTRSAGPAENKQKSETGAQQQYANLDRELLTKLIDHIIENTEDVGTAFPEEARKIHYQEAPERRIRGTASNTEVDALKDEGIEVVALPLPAHLLGKTH